MNIVTAFESNQIRFVEHPTSAYAFGIVATDLASTLEIQRSNDLISCVDNEWKGTAPVRTPGGMQTVSVIWEPGVYQALAKSRKPKAKPFQKWLFEEVLPEIRKTGSYGAGAAQSAKAPAPFQLPQTYLEALKALVATEEERQRLEAKVEEDAPLVSYASAVQASETALDMNEYAKSINWGRNRLFRVLRELGVIMQSSTLPYQRWLDAGYFEVSQEIITGTGKLVPFALVTGKGQIWLKQKIDVFLAQEKRQQEAFGAMLVNSVFPTA